MKSCHNYHSLLHNLLLSIARASGDRVALDVEASKALKKYRTDNRLDMEICDFPQIKHAAELGSRSGDPNEIIVVLE